MTLTATTGTYINPNTFGRYPNAYIDYHGDRHNGEIKQFVFKFNLVTEDGDIVDDIYWNFEGDTPSGNTIQNHGVIISGGTSGATETTDFVQFTLNGGNYDYSGHTIVSLPTLSYDDIDSYFILGNKKDKVLLPDGANPKKLVKWLFLNSVRFNGELIGNQFGW